MRFRSLSFPQTLLSVLKRYQSVENNWDGNDDNEKKTMTLIQFHDNN